MMKAMTHTLIKLMRHTLKHGIALCLMYAVTVAGAEASILGDSGVRETTSRGEATEEHLPAEQTPVPWIHDPAVSGESEGDVIERGETTEKDIKTIKVDNLVPPIYFGLGEVEIPAETLKRLQEILDGMRDRTNVRLHFIGNTDNLPLRHELLERYGDNVGLSRERAGTAAEYCQRALNLPAQAISFEGLGDTHPVADNATEEGRQLNRRVEVQVWYDEVTEKTVETEVIVPREVNRIKVCRTETVCKLRYKQGHSHRARVKNLVTPFHYDEGMADVPESFLRQVKHALANLNGKQNLVVKFIAYTDNMPLNDREKRIYGNHTGFSKAVARRIALAVQENLALPNKAIESEGRGASQPVAANDTQQGRVLNRRVEVEFWHDDPLQDLPDEPQICPDAAGVETVVRIYDAASGPIKPILFENGQPMVPDGYTDQLQRAMDEISDKNHVRLLFVGYTGDKRLDRRAAAVYGDDVGLSMSRARRAMLAVSQQMGLAENQAEFDGRGYVHSNDVVNAGFIESDISYVQVQVAYDEPVLLDDYEGVEITPITREVVPSDPFGLNPMRITVDGKPINDPGKCSADVQRCTDVALDDAHIQFKYDSHKREPRLNVTAWPRTIRYRDREDTVFEENRVQFRLYTNYRSFIERAEVRIFDSEQSLRSEPIAVIPMDADGMAHWSAKFESFAAPVRKLKYLVRVYDGKGYFDETYSQPLWVTDTIDPSVAESDPRVELLVGYGESQIANRNIRLSGGTVWTYGEDIPEGHRVWLAGYEVPVSDMGQFVAEEILPEGIHSVEVGVLDENGNGEVFLRDLALKQSDWFTVGIADLTVSGNKTSGPAEMLAPEKDEYEDDISAEGRLAFYTNGQFENGWSLTASADTREGSFDEIFSNFLDKSPEALFRRMDPDYHYPTYGDDSTVDQSAPTLGKFYVKAEKDDNYGMWGNFKVGYMDNELTQVDRGLYGAKLHYQTHGVTEFGDPRLGVDGFAADPGTIAARDEFLGTGGSLYYLRRQDILEGSERIRIEIRDKVSGIVMEVKNLTPVLDYTIDYLQGRILLARPLSPTATDDLLVRSDSLSGNPAYLVVRYEFSPGFEEPETLAVGGTVHYWFNDHVKLGLTASRDEEADIESNLSGADLTLRKSSDSWLKVETGRSEGPGVVTSDSVDGGYDFTPGGSLIGSKTKAPAYRVDASIKVSDFFDKGRGQATGYFQDLGAGYSAPGLTTARDLTQYGGTATFPFTDRLGTRLKVDIQDQQEGLDSQTSELDFDYRFGEHWTLSSGVRNDSREDNALIVPETQEEGDLTDVVAQLLYDSRKQWTSYGFAQGTIRTTGNRQENDRIGGGGSYRFTDRFNVVGEVSAGDYGPGGRIGTEFLYTDRTTFYNNYTYENERTDNGLRARKGNFVSGFRTRYRESTSVFLEERYTHGDVPTGLTHATGVALAPTDRLNFGLNLEFGTLKDHQTAAELERSAYGMNAGYGFDDLKITSAVEYLIEDTEQLDTSFTKRTTWLFKNSLRYQLSESWRIIGKFNYSQSESSLGEFFDSDYTEAVLGYAYRPVQNDRLNALFKYTYFYNMPSAGQLAGTDTGVIQRSHIGSVDVTYDLTLRWTLGGKYAYRDGQVAQDRENPEFFDSRAHLCVLRADWHFIHRWDALFEVRWLDLPDAQDNRSGVLLGIFRHLGNYVKAGIGYNFSDFSDDLTQMDYHHQGLFINVVGKI
jgi:flagellar motor protein MotB